MTYYYILYNKTEQRFVVYAGEGLTGLLPGIAIR